jgi:peptide/nickel transport system ATP-binding protein/peptide/nickel transport system permease protein
VSSGRFGELAAAEVELDAAARAGQPEGGSGRAARRHPVLRAFLRAPGGIGGGAIFLALIILGVIAPSIWGSEANTTNVNIAYQSHSAAHLLGTDSLGRDILARTLAATRLTLELGAAAAGISAVVGFGVGTLVASLGPRLRSLGRRAIEISMSFPPILFALFLVTIIGTGAKGAVIAIGFGAAPAFARLAENYATSINSKEFIASARATGVGRGRLVFRYLLPNMAEPLVLAGLAYFAGSIIDISGLDFLGVGVQPPSYDWGTLLTTGVQSIYVTPWAAVAPAVMITLTGMAIVYLGEAIARAMNPRLWFVSSRQPRSLRLLDRYVPQRAKPTNGPATTGASETVMRAEDLNVLVPTESGPRHLVRGVSLELGSGEVLGIVGETGSGKTLTALSLARLVPHPLRVQAARLEVDGQELSTLPPRREARLLGTAMAMIFQDPMSSMNPAARVGPQLVDGARRHRSLSRRQGRAEAVQRLGEVRIGDAKRALRRYPYQFSGGMQQRIMIAMGLMARPRILLADEPTTALDVTVQAQVLEVLREIKEKENTSIVLISHNLGVINQLCDRVVVMYAGRIVEEGSRERLLREPRHPYTQGLLASIPELSDDGNKRLSAIPGRPPAPGEETVGCAFAARCPIACERCRKEQPPLETVGPNDRVACFVAVEAAQTGSFVTAEYGSSAPAVAQEAAE